MTSETGPEPLSPDAARHLDQACNAFERLAVGPAAQDRRLPEPCVSGAARRAAWRADRA